jgi:predicted nucleotidyltransferase
VPTTEQILEQIKTSVRATDPDATLILYGSYARGDYRVDSDMDVLVLLDKEKITFDDRKRIAYPLYDIEMDINIHISPMIYSRNSWDTKVSITPFYKNVMREGIVL